NYKYIINFIFYSYLTNNPSYSKLFSPSHFAQILRILIK
ncbi:hypothetical protein KSS87_001958, partial [Heliosperma pusillum]